jgi:hypothetical protein
MCVDCAQCFSRYANSRPKADDSAQSETTTAMKQDLAGEEGHSVQWE